MYWVFILDQIDCKFLRLAVVAFLLFVPLAGSSCAEIVSPKDLFDSRLNRDLYAGKTITYTVEYKNVAEGSGLEAVGRFAISGTRILEVGSPQRDQTGIPYRLTHKISNPGESYIDTKDVVAYFEVFDGVSTQVFVRNFFFDQCEKVSLEHNGYFDAGPQVRLHSVDPIIKSLFQGTNIGNRMVGVASANTVGDPSPEYKLSVVEENQFPKLYKISRDERWTVFLPEPELLVVNGNEPAQQIAIESFFKVENVQYPKKGTCTTQAWECDFEVLGVVPLVENPTDWFREWPEGTSVVNSVDDKVERILFSPNSLSAIQNQIAKNCGLNPIQGKRSSWLLYLNFVLFLTVSVGWWIQRRHNAVEPAE